MSYECSCDFDPPTVSNIRRVKARRQYACGECGVPIKPGDTYEYVWMIYDGMSDTYRTCGLCLELRDWARISVPCFCWYYEFLHENVREMVSEVCHDVPGFVFEWGRRMVKIRRAMAEHRPGGSA